MLNVISVRNLRDFFKGKFSIGNQLGELDLASISQKCFNLITSSIRQIQWRMDGSQQSLLILPLCILMRLSPLSFRSIANIGLRLRKMECDFSSCTERINMFFPKREFCFHRVYIKYDSNTAIAFSHKISYVTI